MKLKHTPGPWTVELVSRSSQSASIQSESDIETQGFHSGRKIAFVPSQTLTLPPSISSPAPAPLHIQLQ